MNWRTQIAAGKCANGCDAPICPPSLVICRSCLDNIGKTLRKLVSESKGGETKMAQDRSGKFIHPGDVVIDSKGVVHTVYGVLTPDGKLHGDRVSVASAKFVDFARDVELVEKASDNASADPLYVAPDTQVQTSAAAPVNDGDQSIVWGNGPK